MKKLIAIILVALMCVSLLASCTDLINKPEDTTAPAGESTTEQAGNETTEPAGTETTEPAGTETTEPAGDEYDVEAAAEYVDSLYKKGNTVTAADYTVVAQVMIAGVKYTITWSVDNELVKVVQGESAWTIDVDEKAAEEHTYTLTGTITAPDGTTATVAYERSVPKYVLVSFEDYMAAEKGTTVVIEGIVVAMNGKSANNKYNHLFLADASGKGGYYCYSLDDDPVAAGVKVGMTVSVTSVVEPYSGMQELKGGTFTIVDDTIKTVEPLDITEKFAAGADLKNYVAMAVTIKGVKIGTQDMSKDTSQYLYFSIGEKEGYVRTYVSDFPTSLEVNLADGVYTSPDKAIIDADHAAHFGYKADVTGILILYSGNPYLIPMSVTPFTNYEEITYTPAEKVEEELKNLTITDAITADTTIELPLAGQNYDDVKFAWTVDNTDFTIGEDGKVEIKLSANAVTLKFTVTATVGEGETAVTQTKEYIVNVAPNFVMSETRPYVPYINQVGVEKELYLDGGVSGRYLTTTTDASKAVSVYAEKAAGGYKFYILVEGAKQYITIYKNSDNKTSVNYDANGTTVFSYNPVTNALVTVFDGGEVYLGIYGTFETVSVSNCSYITAENTGVSQFPLELLAAAPGGAYTGSLTQVKLENKVLYLDGGVNGRYLTTTEDATKAVAVYAEKVAGGFKFYILVEGAKQYITVYNNADGKLSVKYDAEGTSVYEYNATVNAWVTVFENTEYYLGTYNTFNTVSASKLSYITAENTGVEQFPLEYNAIVVAEDEHVCEFADATCTSPKTCECGKTEGEALGHNIVENVCQNCGAKVVTVTEAAALEDGTLVLITATVSKITYAWSDSNKNMSVDITDGTTTLNAYKLATQVGAGDVITVYGKVGSYKGTKQIVDATATVVTAHTCTEFTEATCDAAKTCKVCGKADGEALGHNYVDGTCSACGAVKPASTTYAFADYTAGEQYAANEVHKLDDDVTVTTTDCHFTTELRLYYSAINDYNPNGRNGVAVFAMSSAVKSLSLNAGNKTNPLTIYGSTDGEEWTLITTITPASAYTDYPIELGETAYTFIKLAATEGQVRVASITVELA